jgi:hypothetical protein
MQPLRVIGPHSCSGSDENPTNPTFTFEDNPYPDVPAGNDISERVAMEVGGWKTTSVFHRYAIVDNEDIANAMDMLERSQDQQRRHLEKAVAAKGRQIVTIIDGSPNQSSRREPQSITTGNSALTSLTSRWGCRRGFWPLVLWNEEST